MSLIDYARVSTAEVRQVLDRRLAALNVAGCPRVFEDHASGAVYSLIKTAKANGLESYAYLRYVFTEMPKAPALVDVEALLSTRLDPSRLANASTSLETS